MRLYFFRFEQESLRCCANVFWAPMIFVTWILQVVVLFGVFLNSDVVPRTTVEAQGNLTTNKKQRQRPRKISCRERQAIVVIHRMLSTIAGKRTKRGKKRVSVDISSLSLFLEKNTKFRCHR